MKKEDKEQFVSELHARLEKAQGAFLVNHQGLKVEELEKLRRELRNSGVMIEVVKNRLLKLAAGGTQTESIKDFMKGPTAVALIQDDPIGPAKVIMDFIKDNKKFELKYGQIAGKQLNAEAVKKLATLPGREGLLSMVLGCLQSVPTGFVRVLNGITCQLLYVLKAIEEQKQSKA